MIVKRDLQVIFHCKESVYMIFCIQEFTRLQKKN